jgi:hypothetical protein
MKNLHHVIEDLNGLSHAYANRVEANGVEHPDNPYLTRQAMRFYTAAQAIEDAIADSRDRRAEAAA